MKETVLITGGAGSLGKAFVNSLKDKYKVIVVDNNEWAIAEMRADKSIDLHLGDYIDYDFDAEPVDYVIHCAAYKHVDLGETNPTPFIDNNIMKTEKLFKKLYCLKIPFVFISTDKAVEPISLYGFTKAIGEKLALYYGGSIARLGNILASNGSVIPRWEELITKEQPVEITDERMTRYFIEDFEAVTQIWDQFKAHEKIIIPKCKEIRILDLLTHVLQKKGYDKASDYTPGIVFTGMRPGERLHERLEWPYED